MGGVFAFVTGFPFALFNGCVVVERAAPPELEEALAWVTAHGVPHRVWLAEQAAQKLEAVPTAYGLGRDPASFPGMVLHPVPEPPPPAVGVTVESVDAQDLGSLHHVAVESGLAPELASQMYPPSLATDGDVCLFVGRLDARPVASSLAIRSREASGVYAVGTLADARRRGVGTAMTWAAVDAGRAWGYDSIVLQSSEMALPMYEAMGFRTIVRYVTFSQPAPD